MTTLSTPATISSFKEPAAKAATIYEYTHASVMSLLTAYDTSRTAKKGKAGATTDAEQDILRAALVVAASGFDAMLKQLIRDTLPFLVDGDYRVSEGLEKFIQRQVKSEDGGSEAYAGAKFFAKVLAASSTQGAVIDQYIRELTGDSLQSADQIMKAAAALGVDTAAAKLNPKELRDIFLIRNKIIHELDIDLDGSRRKRNQRKQDDMVKYCDTLLKTGIAILKVVDEKLWKTGRTSHYRERREQPRPLRPSRRPGAPDLKRWA